MITGVLAILAGETAVPGSPGLLVWCGVFLAGNWVFFAVVEEPRLGERFGDPYREGVPRWIPRRSPWHDGSRKDECA